jgi:hypothetical protein
MNLVFGAGRHDRTVDQVEDRLIRYRKDVGLDYLDYRPATALDRLYPEDLAVTILISSRVGASAFKSVQLNGPSLHFADLPQVSLETSSEAERDITADFIARMTSWPGFGASVATKVLHKKRPDLIPILDNQAIFGAYMFPLWPGKKSLLDTIKSRERIKEGLDWIHHDLNRAENIEIWPRLAEIEPSRTRNELFDMVWWIYFRDNEPVVGSPAAPLT